MWQNYIQAASLDEVVRVLAEQGPSARVIAGATDLILELDRGVRTGINTLVDVTRIPGLKEITQDRSGMIHLGPLVTHNDCVASPLIVKGGFPLAQAAWEVGAPQIRNRGTIAGNLITASPANDTITPLMALGASLLLRSLAGERLVPLAHFYTGVRKTVMRPDEVLVDIRFPALQSNERGCFIKIGLRRAQAISVVNACVVLGFANDRVSRAVITLGATAPTIVRAGEAEAYLVGKSLDETVMAQAALLAKNAARPIDDIRGSAPYRHEMVRVAVLRCLRSLAHGTQSQGYPARPPLLSKTGAPLNPTLAQWDRSKGPLPPIIATINGKEQVFTSGHEKTLLRLLREEAGLIGTKEGCAEGECGACTVILDGMAVMSCLVPAPRAHGAEIVTIEGLAKDGKLHPVQQAFIDAGAVQCGYCTPGFIMSGAMLLDEIDHPTHEQVQQAITGNLCRCTGYYKIVEAIEAASIEAGSASAVSAEAVSAHYRSKEVSDG